MNKKKIILSIFATFIILSVYGNCFNPEISNNANSIDSLEPSAETVSSENNLVYYDIEKISARVQKTDDEYYYLLRIEFNSQGSGTPRGYIELDFSLYIDYFIPFGISGKEFHISETYGIPIQNDYVEIQLYQIDRDLSFAQPSIMNLEGSIKTYNGTDGSFCTGDIKIDDSVIDRPMDFFKGTGTQLILILLIGLVVITLILILNFTYNRSLNKQATQNAYDLMENGILSAWRGVGKQKLDEIEEENQQKENLKNQLINERTHTAMATNSVFDQVNQKKQRIVIPGFYDTTVTFKRFIFYTAITAVTFLFSIFGFINYFTKFPRNDDIPVLLIIYVIIIVFVIGIVIAMIILLPLVKAPKYSLKNIDRLIEKMPQLETKGSFAVKMASKVDHVNSNLDRKTSDFFIVKLLNSGIMASFIIYMMWELELLSSATYKALMPQLNWYDILYLVNNDFSGLMILIPILKFFIVIAVFVGLLFSAVFTIKKDQYAQIANIGIATGLIALGNYLSYENVLLMRGILIYVIEFLVFTILVVPRQDAKDHQYKALVAPNSAWHSNVLLYLSERLHSQRAYIYFANILCLTFGAIRILKESNQTFTNWVYWINLSVFIFALILDHTYLRTSKHNRREFFSNVTYQYYSIRNRKLALYVFGLLLVLGIINIQLIISSGYDIFYFNFAYELVIAMKIALPLFGNKIEKNEEVDYDVFFMTIEHPAGSFIHQTTLKLDLLFNRENFIKYSTNTGASLIEIQEKISKIPMAGGIKIPEIAGKIIRFMRKYLIIEILNILILWVGVISTFVSSMAEGDSFGVIFLDEAVPVLFITSAIFIAGWYLRLSESYYARCGFDVLLLCICIWPLNTAMGIYYLVLAIVMIVLCILSAIIFKLIGIDWITTLFGAVFGTSEGFMQSIIKACNYLLNVNLPLLLIGIANILPSYILGLSGDFIELSWEPIVWMVVSCVTFIIGLILHKKTDATSGLIRGITLLISGIISIVCSSAIGALPIYDLAPGEAFVIYWIDTITLIAAIIQFIYTTTSGDLSSVKENIQSLKNKKRNKELKYIDYSKTPKENQNQGSAEVPEYNFKGMVFATTSKASSFGTEKLGQIFGDFVAPAVSNFMNGLNKKGALTAENATKQLKSAIKPLIKNEKGLDALKDIVNLKSNGGSVKKMLSNIDVSSILNTLTNSGLITAENI